MKSYTPTKNLLIAAVSLCGISTLSYAQNWDGTTGNWDTATNWTGDTEPGAASIARIDNGGTAQVTTDNTVDRVWVAFGGGTSGTLELNSGTLASTGTSNWGQSAGSVATININGGTFRGQGATSIDGTVDGTSVVNVNMTSGALISEGTFNADRGGAWNYNLTGGRVAIRNYQGVDGVSAINFNGTTTYSSGDVGAAGRSDLIGTDWTFGATSNFHFDLGGTTQATNTSFQQAGAYDTVVFQSTSTLAFSGDLDIAFIEGFESTITDSDSFTIINTSGDLSGSIFANVVAGRVTTVGGEGTFAVEYINGDSDIRLSDFQAIIPEPGTYALLAGLAGLTLVALRRRKA